MSTSPPPRAGWLVLIPSVVALLVYAPTLTGGFLSDDFLLDCLLDRSTDEVRVSWGAVLADFARPWLGIEGSVLYRPVMSVSYAIDLLLGGGSPVPFHVTNVLAHVIATASCAWLCARFSPARPRLAAVVGGLLFALHPAAVEATAWVS